MTREEILNGLYDIKNWHCNGNSEMHSVIAEAIKALEQEPCNEELDFVQEHKKISCNLIVEPCEDADMKLIHTQGLDEAIKHAEEVAEANQRVVDTGIVFDDVTIDMLYCDDTEVIEEHLANYQRCAEEQRQLAEWLKDYKRLLEPKTEWIPVSKRLPEPYIGEWLCCTSDGDIMVLPYDTPGDGTKECVFYKWDDRFDFYDTYDVIAWMPLPKPYEPQESEG